MRRKIKAGGESKGIIQEFQQFSYRLGFSVGTIFFDAVQIAALRQHISILKKPEQAQQKNEQLSEIAKVLAKYKDNTLQLENIIEQIINKILEGYINGHCPDVLGELFHRLDLHNEFKGQFFSPMTVASFMAAITFNETRRPTTEKVFTLMEPCCGSGVMVIAALNYFAELGVYNPRNMMVFANDLDINCCYMAYLQFSLLGISAIVTQGNALSLDMEQKWLCGDYLITPSAQKLLEDRNQTLFESLGWVQKEDIEEKIVS